MLFKVCLFSGLLLVGLTVTAGASDRPRAAGAPQSATLAIRTTGLPIQIAQDDSQDATNPDDQPADAANENDADSNAAADDDQNSDAQQPPDSDSDSQGADQTQPDSPDSP